MLSLLIGEAVGIVLFYFYSASNVRSLLTGLESKCQAVVEVKEKDTGRFLYLSYILSMGPSNVDKSIVASALGTAAAGTYGLVAMIVQVGMLVVNIVSQRIGPRFIKLALLGCAPQKILFELIAYVLLFAALMAVSCSVLVILMSHGLGANFIQNYSITVDLVVIAGLVSVFQVFAFFDFFLLSYNKEKVILAASSIAFIVFVIGFSACVYLGGTLEAFLVVGAIARFIQVLILIVAVWYVIKDARGVADELV